MPLLPQSIADLVLADGTPREATDDAGAQHMLYRDGAVVRSALIADWPAEELAQAARDAARARRAALRAAHAGKRVDQLTLPELRDVVAVLLERAGMLDEDGRVVG